MHNEHKAYGYHAVAVLVETKPEEVREVLLAQERNDRRAREIARLCTKRKIPLRRVSAKQIDAITHDAVHQGVLAFLRTAYRPLPTLQEVASKTDPLVVVLDHLQDPHNVGAIIRTAAAAGADAIIIPARGAAPITATVRKVAAGTVNMVPILPVSNIRNAIKVLKKQGVWCYGLDGNAQTSIYNTDMSGGIALVLGAEGTGLSHIVKQTCDTLVRIPFPRKDVESLNVSVAGGIALFEAVRQRGLPQGDA